MAEFYEGLPSALSSGGVVSMDEDPPPLLSSDESSSLRDSKITLLQGEIGDLRRVLRDTVSRLSHVTGERMVAVGEEMAVAPEGWVPGSGGDDDGDNIPPRGRRSSHSDAYWKDQLYKVAMERSDAERRADKSDEKAKVFLLERDAARHERDAALGDRARMVASSVAKTRDVMNENERLKKEVSSLKDEEGALNLQLSYAKQEMDQLGSAHDKLIEQMKKEAEDALVHEKAMGSGLQAVHEERAVLRAKVDELEKVQTATSADAPARIALLTAELQSSNDELEVVRGELDAAVASLASVTLGRGVARGEVLVARRELAAVEKDMEAMVKQKDGMNRFLESKIVTLERQAEAMRLIPAPAVAPVVRGRGRGRGRGVDT
jgi:hypothetical protein